MKRTLSVTNFGAFGMLCCATAAAQAPTIPPVLLTKEHAAMCKLKVGDTLPAIELDHLGGSQTKLSELYGRLATVVVFWTGDNRMSQTALADLQRDVVEQFGPKGAVVVGVAVKETADDAGAALENANATFPILLDTDGQAFAQVGIEKLPRLYLVDPDGEILWFDIEYSLATRRELNQSFRALLNANR